MPPSQEGPTARKTRGFRTKFREEGDNYYVYTKVIPEALRINLNYDLRRWRVEELLRKRFLSFPFLIVKSCMISDLGDLLIHSE
jgi:hypothetical protein